MKVMKEIVYLPEVECIVEGPSVLENYVDVSVMDEKGKREYLWVADGLVVRDNGTTYLPIGIVELEHSKRRALIELPYEADSGAHRMWMPFDSFHREDSTASSEQPSKSTKKKKITR